MTDRTTASEEKSSAPYRLEYAVRVWKQLMGLSAEEIALLGRELEQLATQARDARGAAPRNLHLADLAVSYEVSEGRQVLTVLGIARREPKTD